MTARELMQKLNDEFAFGDFPDHYEVDAETYGNVCQAVFDNCGTELDAIAAKRITLSFGVNNGLIYKNVELILNNHKRDIKTEEEVTFLSAADLQVLYDLLKSQYIAYDNEAGILLVRKIRNLLGEIV